MAVTPSPSPSVSVGSWYNPHKGAGAPASTLGNVGDTYFDTTHNVYYVKGTDGWQTTQGSTQSIPAASSSNLGMILTSNGTSWTVSPNVVWRTASVAWATKAVCILHRKNATNMQYFGLVKCYAGNHSVSNNYITISVHGHGTSFNDGTLCIDISTTEAHGVEGQSTRLNVTDFKFYTSTDGTKLYVRYNNTSAGGLTMLTYAAHGGAFYNTADATVCSTEDYSGLTEITSGITYNTTVPVSTAANQMLVSDGNGGWKMQYAINNPSATRNEWGTTATAASTYSMFKIGELVNTTSTSSRLFHLTFDIQCGRHDEYSIAGHIDIIGSYTGSTHTLNSARATCVWFPTSKTVNGTPTYGDYIYPQNTMFLNIYFKVNDSTNKIEIFYGAYGGTWGAVTQFTLRNMIVDEDVLALHNYGTLTANYSISDISAYTAASKVTWISVPVCTTADNGKVLKVVNGVPAWTSA